MITIIITETTMTLMMTMTTTLMTMTTTLMTMTTTMTTSTMTLVMKADWRKFWGYHSRELDDFRERERES